MFTLSPPEWFLALLLTHFTAIFALSLFYFIRRLARRPPRHAATSFFRCKDCGHVYLNYRNLPMAECEKCGAMNESVRSF